MALVVKNLPAARDTSSIPGLGRSPGEGHGKPLQYSCLEKIWTEENGRMETEVGGQEGEGCMMRLGSWVGPPDPRKPRAEHPPGT